MEIINMNASAFDFTWTTSGHIFSASPDFKRNYFNWSIVVLFIQTMISILYFRSGELFASIKRLLDAKLR